MKFLKCLQDQEKAFPFSRKFLTIVGIPGKPKEDVAEFTELHGIFIEIVIILFRRKQLRFEISLSLSNKPK
jgi:hypothetical protein